LDSTWNIGSIGMAGPPLRGPSSPRLLAEPPLSPPVSAGPAPTASAQPLQPSREPLAPPATSISVGSTAPGADGPEPAQRPAVSLEALLMRFRLITSEQLDEAMREKAETGKDVGAVVVERGWVNEDQLARLLTYAPAFPASTDASLVEPESVPVPTADVAPIEEHHEPAELAPVADAAPFTEPVAEPVVEQIAEPVAEPSTFEPAPTWSTPEVPALPEFPPALELIEPEPEPEAVSFADEPAPTEPEPVVAEAEPVMALEPVAPEQDPFTPEPAFFASHPEPEPVAVEPEPVAVEPEPVAVEPEPVAAVIDPIQPAPVIAPVEPQPEPRPEPAEVAAETQVVRFVEPAAIETIARVFVRLSNGERVEAGSFDDMAAAKARAEEVVAQVSTSDNGWPFFGGRYIRPEAVVSVDVDATVVRYA
jgi:hypothetical protein